ncbi:hypothetical protein BDN72DRAFT_421373 [Pluteus cervinus]|uniref:Uncharacterized protein n=1 Tax=Pluteus cervinus TaxID=181527 RepID=A0ACD3AAJ7_9AGAR|nr:hypothetical protein BDN72DRAFT_421373 [Pluteus cervinus]
MDTTPVTFTSLSLTEASPILDGPTNLQRLIVRPVAPGNLLLDVLRRQAKNLKELWLVINFGLTAEEYVPQTFLNLSHLGFFTVYDEWDRLSALVSFTSLTHLMLGHTYLVPSNLVGAILEHCPNIRYVLVEFLSRRVGERGEAMQHLFSEGFEGKMWLMNPSSWIGKRC